MYIIRISTRFSHGLDGDLDHAKVKRSDAAFDHTTDDIQAQGSRRKAQGSRLKAQGSTRKAHGVKPATGESL